MIKFENVSKIFGTGAAGLSEITISIEKGEFVFLVGHTGSGKTTMLRLLIREMTPSTGTIYVEDFNLSKLPSRKIPHLRKKIGIVFQDLKLLMDRTIFENVLLPLQVAGVNMKMAKERAEELLTQVDVITHRDKFPVQLSGGELQRVAIARALALSPAILLADEPTGNLDADTANGIVELLTAINQRGTTIIMATHNMDIVEKLKKRVVTLDKGKIMKDETHEAMSKNKEIEKSKKEETKEEEKNDEKSEKKQESKDTGVGENHEVKEEKQEKGKKGKSRFSSFLKNAGMEKKSSIFTTPPINEKGEKNNGTF